MMERALKERIVGAIVIVALVVLVVPVFLDGPPNSGDMISERVPLPGQDDQQTQTIVLDRVRDEPVPAQENPQTEAPDQPANDAMPQIVEEAAVVEEAPANAATAALTKTPKPEPPKPEQQPVVESNPPASTTTSATGMWAVQLGSFSNQENAERLAADLRKQGFAAFLSQLSTTSGQLHRVRIGPQKDREAAEKMAARLQKAGHKGKVLPHP